MIERNRLLFSRSTRRVSRTKIIVGIFLLFILYSLAYASPQTEAPLFTDTLKSPPAFVPEFMAEKENAATLYSDGIYAVYAADRADDPKNRKQTHTVTASDYAGRNWTLEMEPMSSPVIEEHGNAERHESLGGIVKGTIHF